MNDLASFIAKGYVRSANGQWHKPKPRRADVARIHTVDAQRSERNSLERPVPREDTCSTRLTVRFTIYSQHPGDWDGYDIKWIQDMLVAAGIISSDDWASLEGSVRSEKVHSKDKERTEILIESFHENKADQA